MCAPSIGERKCVCTHVRAQAYTHSYRHVYTHSPCTSIYAQVSRHVHTQVELVDIAETKRYKQKSQKHLGDVSPLWDPEGSQAGKHIGHNHIDHNYIGHNYIGHNYICLAAVGPRGVTGRYSFDR